MGLQANIKVFAGSPKRLKFRFFADDEKTACIDVTGWEFEFVVREGETNPVNVLRKVSGFVVTGVFNASPASNTQLVELPLTEADLTIKPHVYNYALHRTNAGQENPTHYGDFRAIRVTKRGANP